MPAACAAGIFRHIAYDKKAGAVRLLFCYVSLLRLQDKIYFSSACRMVIRPWPTGFSYSSPITPPSVSVM